MRPLSGRISRTMLRASVDFPQPDSPTMPRVSPRRTVRLTSRSADMSPPRRPDIRPNIDPRRTKLTARSSMTISGPAPAGTALGSADIGMADAGGTVIGGDLDQRHVRGAAFRDRQPAARHEGAAGLVRHGLRRLAGD